MDVGDAALGTDESGRGNSCCARVSYVCRVRSALRPLYIYGNGGRGESVITRRWVIRSRLKCARRRGYTRVCSIDVDYVGMRSLQTHVLFDFRAVEMVFLSV